MVSLAERIALTRRVVVLARRDALIYLSLCRSHRALGTIEPFGVAFGQTNAIDVFFVG